MPLKTDTWELKEVSRIVDAFPENVIKATVQWNHNVYDVVWSEEDGHVITWKEPRK